MTTTSSITRHETALERLRDAIVAGDIPAGSRLIQDDLAEKLGVSRIPLREALRTLHGEGLIVIEPHRGALCRPLDAKDLFDLYGFRLALERLAVVEASARFCDVRPATRALRERARSAERRGDRMALIALDRAFHAGLAEASGNAHVVRALDGCWSQIARAMFRFFTLPVRVDDVWDAHEALARAVAFGDGSGAQALLERHITDSRTAILSGLKEADE